MFATYLAAHAGAELGAPAVRPEHGSLSQPLQPLGLQLLQPADGSFGRSLRRTARHFLVGPFARGTPARGFLKTQIRTEEDGGRCCIKTGRMI